MHSLPQGITHIARIITHIVHINISSQSNYRSWFRNLSHTVISKHYLNSIYGVHFSALGTRFPHLLQIASAVTSSMLHRAYMCILLVQRTLIPYLFPVKFSLPDRGERGYTYAIETKFVTSFPFHDATTVKLGSNKIRGSSVTVLSL